MFKLAYLIFVIITRCGWSFQKIEYPKMAHIVDVTDEMKLTISRVYLDQICNEIRSSIPGVWITDVLLAQNNEFLHAAYQLRKAQFELTHGYQCTTEDLYHDTAAKNVPSILRDNLDWRRVKRSRYGKGVSFSISPAYANTYSNEKNGTERAFIFCEVLIGIEQIVDGNYTQCSKNGIDTHRSQNNMVVVKFEDDTFYPKLVIYYQTSSPGPARPLSASNSYDEYEYINSIINSTNQIDSSDLPRRVFDEITTALGTLIVAYIYRYHSTPY